MIFPPVPSDPRTIADFTATLPGGATTGLGDRLGKVVLVVNTASKCGFTPQYQGLEKLWRRYSAQGFEVIAFPCNQFGKQEPGDAAEIASFCELNFGLSFPLMGKVEVNGAGTTPFYAWLKARAPGLLGSKSIKWNFTKFLIDSKGRVVRRYAPTEKPEALADDIEKLLGARVAA
jgi:glutathione peroxidase